MFTSNGLSSFKRGTSVTFGGEEVKLQHGGGDGLVRGHPEGGGWRVEGGSSDVDSLSEGEPRHVMERSLRIAL